MLDFESRMTSFARCAVALAIVIAAVIGTAVPAVPFAVLAHEAIIDNAWNEAIRDLVVRRFPHVSEQELKDAYAYAHGGSMIQDMGYYPFGKELFSDLTHLVRSGDFIGALIAEAQDPKELAFALGAVAHYAADTTGHPRATNASVPVMYPKLREKYGDWVPYEKDPTAHLQTEFSFDVLQVAKAGYDTKQYYDFLGFKVANGVLERAFLKTYGIPIEDIFDDLEVAITTYRFAVSEIIPEATKLAWAAKSDEIEHRTPGITEAQFVFEFSRGDFERLWGTDYQRPGFFRRVIGIVIRFLPKFGPLKAFSYKPPTPEVEEMFFTAFAATEDTYRYLLDRYRRDALSLPNRNFDTGTPVRAGEYRTTDDTYAQLVLLLAKRDPATVDCAVRADVLAFYGDGDAPIATKRDSDEWAEVSAALDRLRAAGGGRCGADDARRAP